MSNIGRRLFAGLFASAPVALGVEKVIPTSPELPNPMWSHSAKTPGIIGDIVREALPPQLKQYEAAMEVSRRVSASRYHILRQNDPSARRHPNIAALRSVSAQHKIHMELAADEKFQAEQCTFEQSLRDALGLTEWFKKRELSNDQCANAGGY